MRNLLLRTILLIVLLVGYSAIFATNVFTENFEGTSSFTIVNGTQTNKWYVGTPGAYAGTNGVYVSNDTGTTNAYTLTSSSATFLYRSVTFPSVSGAEVFKLSFKWRCSGESTYDGMKVFVDTGTPTAGTAYSTGQVGPTWINLQSSWQTASITIPASYAGTTKNLIIMWKNDSSGGAQPPASIDDISLDTFDPTISTFPYTVNMESGVPPTSWITALGSGTNSNRWTTSTSYNHTSGGTTAAYLYYSSSSASEVYLATPPFSFPSDSYRVRFWFYRVSGTSYSTENLKVYYNTAQNLTGATLIGTYNVSAGNSPAETGGAGWYQYTINMPTGATGTGRYLIFDGMCLSTGTSYYIDDINVEAIPTIPNPAIIGSPANAGTNVLKTATLNWTADGSGAAPTGYKLYFGTDNPPTNIVNGTDLGLVTTYTPSPAMSYGTTYYWKVVPYTGATEATGCSVWSFSTMADPTITSFPYTQNFDALTVPALPLGWSATSSDGDTNTWSTQASNPSSTPNCVRSYYTSTTLGTTEDDWLFTPPVRLTGGTSYTVEYKYRTYNTTSAEKLEFGYGTTATGAGMTNILFSSTVMTTTYTTRKEVFTPGSSADYYLGWHANSPNNLWYIYVDDVSIYVTPPTPNAAVMTYPASSATLIGPSPAFTWTAGTGPVPTGYKFYLGTDNPPTTLVNGTDLGNVLTYTYGSALTASTTYYWKVVPYNADGSCTTPTTQSFTTAALVTAIATTPSPADAAINRSITASLTWATVANATSYDVYFATVADGLPGTANATVTALTWTPPTMVYSTAYTWKVIPKNGFGVTSGTPTVWTFTTMADPTITSFPYSQTFEGTDFPPLGWATAKNAGSSTYLWVSSTSYNHTTSGTKAASLYDYSSTAGDVYLATAPITFPTDQYRVKFWTYRTSGSSYPADTLKVFYNTAQNLTGATLLKAIPRNTTLAPVEANTSGWYQYVANLPAGAAGSNRYLLFDGLTISSYYMYYYIDDVVIEEKPALPLPAVVAAPLNAATGVSRTATLNWTMDGAGDIPTGYKLYFGTDNPPTNIVNGTDLGLVTSYTPATMTYSQVYYWQVVPYTGSTNATGCPVWSFTIMPDPTIVSFPYTEGFESVTVPALPAGWASSVVSTGSGWFTGTLTETHSGTKAVKATYSPSGTSLLNMPAVVLPASNYQISYWWKNDDISKVAGYDSTFFQISTDNVNWTTLKQLSPSSSDGSYHQELQLLTAYSGTVYFRWKYKTDGTYSAYGIGLDDIDIRVIPTAPLPAIVSSPTNGATNVSLTASLNWAKDSAGPDPTGYKLYLGTDNPPTNIANGTDLGLVTTTSPTLLQDMHYYWQIVPYNALGNATGCPVWNFYTVTHPAATTLISPTDAATGVARNVTLSWNSAATATSYDVYLGTTLPGVPTANVSTTSYTVPTLLTATTGYVWKVVPKNAYGDAVSCPTWSFTTGTGIVYATSAASYAADDDIGQFIMADVTNPATHPDSLNNAASTNTYTDYTAITINVLQDHNYPTKIHQINEDTFYSCWGKVFIDFNQNGTFDLPTEQVLSGQTSSTHMEIGGTISIPSDALTGNTRLRVVLRESGTEATTLPSGTYSYGETEDYTINIGAYTAPVPPDAAITPSPSDLATNVSLMPTFTWARGTTGPAPTGYYLSFGTDNPPTSIQFEKDLGLVTSWTPEVGDLAYSTRYYWQVIPYNAVDRADSILTWQFDTMADPTITSFPYDQGFEDATFPPAGWSQTSTGTAYWTRFTGTEVHGGTACAKAAYSPAGTRSLITPPIQLSADMNLSWWEKNDDITSKVVGHDSTWTEISTDNGATWTTLSLMSTASNESAYRQVTVHLAPYTGHTVYLRWRYWTDATSSAWGSGLDDIHIEAVPVNPVLVADKESLLLPVTPIGGGSSDVITLSNSGPGTLTGTVSYSAGLSGPTSFDQSNPESLLLEVTFEPTVCGIFSGTVSITSNGGNVTIPVNSNAGADAVDWETIPGGWSVYNLDADAYNWTVYTGNAHSGSNAVGVHWNSAGCDDWMISPWYTPQAGEKLSFFASSYDATYLEHMTVYVSTSGRTPTDFTTSILDVDGVPAVYTGYEIDLTEYVGQTVSFAFVCSSVDCYYLFIDDIGLPTMAGVVTPTNLAASVVETGVQLDWTAVSGATSYRIYSSADPNAAPEAWTLLSTVYTNTFIDTASNGMMFYKVAAVNGTKYRNDTHALVSQRPAQIVSRKK